MHNEFRHQTKVNMTYIVMAFDNTILSFSSSYHTNRRWKKAKVNVQNQGKMPLIVFGNGFFNDMAIKRHMAAPIKKIYANLNEGKGWVKPSLCKLTKHPKYTVTFYSSAVVSMSLTPFFYSVQICNNCQKRELKKWVAADGREFHGILGCKNCHMLWNRDVNAAKNMYWIAESIWAGHGRPACFQRPSSNITAANAGPTEVG
jgi:hypothetical protein